MSRAEMRIIPSLLRQSALQLEMQAEPRHEYRATIAVVSRIPNMLDIRAGINAEPEMQR